MKLIKFITPAVALACSLGANAQGKYGATPDDSIACIQNLSLMQSYYKQGQKTNNFADAVKPWHDVYNSCPQSHSSIYQFGPRILAWEMAQAKDATSKKALFNQMMEVYDNRIKFFATSKYPAYYIRGRKAFDYINYAAAASINDPDNKTAYNWLGQSINEGGAENELKVFQQYYLISENLYKKNPATSRQQFVDDYLKVTDLLTKRVDEGVAKDSVYDQLKGAIDYAFGQSGACDCKTLDGIYASQVDAKKDDKDFLNVVVKLYNMADCENSTVYFKASEYLYKIEPSYTAATGLAAQAYNKKDVNGAISYLDKAATLTNSNANKSNIMLKISTLYNKQKNYAKSREYARKAISYNSNNGNAYLIIGTLYANTASTISTDAFIQKTAYWAAVDKFEKAKAVDPTVAATANKLIASYKGLYPSKTEGFMRKLTTGSYTVPGWINETTTIRYNK